MIDTLNFRIALFLFFAVFVTCQSNTNQNEIKKSENNLKGEIALDIQVLENLILAGNMDAVDIVDTMDDQSRVLSLLASMSDEENAEARIVAINCLTLIDTKVSIKALAKFLKDPESEVSIPTLQTISVEEDISLLLSIKQELISNLDHEDPDVRAGIAYVIGRTEDAQLTGPLYKRLEIEDNKDAKRNINLALAKLGDKEKQEEFAHYSIDHDIGTCIKTIEDLKYINEKELTIKLQPALSDLRHGYNIGTKDNPEFSRMCDAAINLIATLNNNPFTFEIGRYKIYSNEEIEEAKTFLQSLKDK